MRRKKFILPMLALPFLMSACGYSVFDAAEDVSENSNELADGTAIGTNWTDTGQFQEMATLGPDNIVFVIGDSFRIKAEGDAETLKDLRFKLRDGKLIIGRAGKKWYKDMNAKAATITLSAPSLRAVAMAGSGNLTAEKLTGETVSLTTAGSGDIDVAAIDTKNLAANVAGSGSVKLAGTASKADFSIAGSGDIAAAKLAMNDADVSIAGSGSAMLNASGKVDVSIAGSGSVTVSGGAKCTSSVIGSGKLNCS